MVTEIVVAEGLETILGETGVIGLGEDRAADVEATCYADLRNNGLNFL